MAFQGPRNPALGVNDASGGTAAWSSPTAIYTSNDTRATSPSTTAGQVSNFLVSQAHGFTIPAGAVIQGILVEIERSINSSSAATVRDAAVRIVKGGVVGATDRSNVSDWTNTEAIFSYGGPTDLWGETWTPADINASNFGAAVAAQRLITGNSLNARVDHIKITVYYAPAQVVAVGQVVTTGLAQPVAAIMRKTVAVGLVDGTSLAQPVQPQRTRGLLLPLQPNVAHPLVAVKTAPVAPTPVDRLPSFADGELRMTATSGEWSSSAAGAVRNSGVLDAAHATATTGTRASATAGTVRTTMAGGERTTSAEDTNG